MGANKSAVHVVRVRKSGYVTKSGERRDYASAYLRRTYREGGTVKNETVANLSALPEHVVDAVEAGVKGERLVPASAAATVTRSLPHGHVAAVAAQARSLGLAGLLGPPCRQRDLALGLIISRVVRPGSKLSTQAWWSDSTLGADFGIADASTDEIYAAMDWLVSRQDDIEKRLAQRHLAGQDIPRMALFDLSSSWMEGTQCPLSARGYSRDGKKGKTQIEYGLLTDPAGCPTGVRVFAGNTADPTAFTEAVDTVRATFGLDQMLMVGDRGMITSARIAALRELGDTGWLTALRAPQVAALAADDGPLQLSLFDQQDLAEISHPDYPGERLVACRNPALAEQRAAKREALLSATETELAKVQASVDAGRLSGADKIGLRVGKVIDKYKMAKHFTTEITDTSIAITRKTAQIETEARLDGIYVLRTSAPADQLDSAGVVTAYKNLAHLERDLRSIKVDDLDLRPIHHHLEDRVRAHVLICMLAAYLVWHLRQAWAELTYTDQHPPDRDNPVAPAQRSEHAAAKASQQHDQHQQPLHSFRGLLDHLATLTRNDLRYDQLHQAPVVPTLAEPTPTQRRAFQLLDTPIPLTLK